MLGDRRAVSALLLLLLLPLVSAGAAEPRRTPRRTLTVSERLIAGGGGRFVGQLVMYPADAMRTLAQTRAGAKPLAELGAQALISGCVTTSSFALVVGAVQFAIFGTLKPILGPLGASMCGAVGSCIISVPQEVIKQRLVTGIYPNFLAAVATIAKTEGPQGFYTAWLPTVTRNVPFVAITFTTFAAVQWRLLRARQGEGRDALTTAENLSIGVTAALLAGLLTQPIDVVKTRLMTQVKSLTAQSLTTTISPTYHY